jgi:hypothetical protein
LRLPVETLSPLSALAPTPWAIRLPERLARELLALGEIVPAAVVASLDSHRALIRIKGRELIAEVPFPLPDQGEFQVRVEQVEPRIVLKLLATASEGLPAEARLKAYLAKDRPAEAVAEAWQALSRMEKGPWPEDIREAWEGFQETLRTFSERFAARPGPQAFKDLVNLSGLNWENKLQELALQPGETDRPLPVREDLKGFLLTLKSRLESADPELARTVQPILQKIELCQWLNASESGKYHLSLFFPWWVPEGLGWTELLISGDRSGLEAPEETGPSLLFLLHLPVLGKLRVEVTLRGQRLFGRFKTERPEVAELLERQIPRLRKGLAGRGYQAALDSRVVEAEQLGDSLPARMAHCTDSLISRMI